MPTTKSPRKGTLQFTPRKKSKRQYPRVRNWSHKKEAKPLGFFGYKVGMTRVVAINENKNAHTVGEETAVPATIVECPPMKMYSARFYKNEEEALKLKKEIFFKTDKNLQKKTNLSKDNSKELDKIDVEEYDSITVTIYTQPSKAGVSKKKPELLEVGLGGKKQEKLDYIKESHNKEIDIESIFSTEDLVDIHAITKGKGNQGPVKRFGIGLKNHKSEKGRRNPGSLGPWNRQQHIMWRVSHAGQTGYHQRTEYNKQILEISADTEKRGKHFHKYGNIKSKYVLLHGSIPGPTKRTIVMSTPSREKKNKHKLSIQE